MPKFLKLMGVGLRRGCLPMMIAIALMLRMIWAVLVGMDPVSDSLMYRDFSNSIVSGVGYAYPDGSLTVFWAVGTSAFYALVEVLFGHADLAVMMVNAIVSVGLIYCIYRVTLHYFGHFAALIAVGLMVAWPISIQFTTVYASEVLFALCIVAALAIWCQGPRNGIVRALVWGVMLCLATYVRPTALPILAMLPVLEFVAEKDLKASLLSFVVVFCIAVLLFAPWVTRNQRVFGAPILVSANFGVNLWMGNNPKSNGGYMQLPDIKFPNEVERDRFYKNEAIEFIKANPGEYLKLAVRRAVMTYDRETIGVAWNEPALRKLMGERGLMAMKLVSTAYWWVMLGLGACGVFLLLRKDWTNLFHPLVVVSGFFFMVPILTVGQDRYHMPLNPFLAMFAAVALEAAWRCYAERKANGIVRAEADRA